MMDLQGIAEVPGTYGKEYTGTDKVHQMELQKVVCIMVVKQELWVPGITGR